ncbi:ABC transporter substrate-binding protein [Deinococcus radiotolerans]|uniref:Solute-binding protein family 5 domain-containing protein n=1 Tax=Deinococcus radiotolerans TaxID=1309407 RepID=A0ABQ2FNI1_9DEIO|nr:ABC transporter substrate-binding protein [Deinococcus radiotolerans]GGL11394.1 hypothetical protein GCM10010844_32600 [Deinococcus radiotolerans]
MNFSHLLPWSVLTAGLLLASCGGGTPPVAAVRTLTDSGPGSLRAVLATAPAGATIQVDTPGTLTLSSPLTVQGDVTIVAPGVVLDGAGGGRVLQVTPGAHVTVRGATLTGGTGAPDAGTPAALAASYTRGGAVLNQGTLRLENVTIQQSVANEGGGIYNALGANLTLKDVTLTGNKAVAFVGNTSLNSGSGGGVSNAGTLVIDHGTVRQNAADRSGGAVFNSGTLTFTAGTVQDNTAAVSGGGIFNASGATYQSTATVTGNRPDDVVDASAPEASGDFRTPPSWTVTAPGDAQRGGTLRVGDALTPTTLNPFLDQTAGSLISRFSPPGGLLIQSPDTTEYLPFMARTVSASADGLVWDVQLRPNLTWSDGQPITAADIVSTVHIHQDPAVGSNSFDALQDVSVVETGPRSLRLTFPAARATNAAALTFAPWPDHIFGAAYRAGGAAAVRALWPATAAPETIVTAGPFVPTFINAADGSATLTRNPNYGRWVTDAAGQPLPYLDGVQVLAAGNAAAQLDAFKAHQLDLLAPTGPAVDALQGLTGTVLRDLGPAASSTWIVWNFNRASQPEKQRLFRETAFRQAMSHLANRARMVSEILGGRGQPVYTSVYPVFSEWISPGAPKFDYDLAEARRLLGTLGYTTLNAGGYLTNASGQVLEFDLNTNAGNTNREKAAGIFAEEAMKVGVKVNVNKPDFNTLVEQLTSAGPDRPFDAILLGLSGGSSDWPYGANVIPCSGNLHAYNQSGACLFPWEQEMQQLFEQGSREPTLAQRRVIGAQLQAIEGQQQPFVQLFSPNVYAAWSSQVRGEYPPSVGDSYFGARLLDLTWLIPSR